MTGTIHALVKSGPLGKCLYGMKIKTMRGTDYSTKVCAKIDDDEDATSRTSVLCGCPLETSKHATGEKKNIIDLVRSGHDVQPMYHRYGFLREPYGTNGRPTYAYVRLPPLGV